MSVRVNTSLRDFCPFIHLLTRQSWMKWSAGLWFKGQPSVGPHALHLHLQLHRLHQANKTAAPRCYISDQVQRLHLSSARHLSAMAAPKKVCIIGSGNWWVSAGVHSGLLDSQRRTTVESAAVVSLRRVLLLASLASLHMLTPAAPGGKDSQPASGASPQAVIIKRWHRF